MGTVKLLKWLAGGTRTPVLDICTWHAEFAQKCLKQVHGDEDYVVETIFYNSKLKDAVEEELELMQPRFITRTKDGHPKLLGRAYVPCVITEGIQPEWCFVITPAGIQGL
jgi:hypothetical protein